MQYLKMTRQLTKELQAFEAKMDRDAFVELFKKRLYETNLKINPWLEDFFSDDGQILPLIEKFKLYKQQESRVELEKAEQKKRSVQEKLLKKETKTALLEKERLDRKISKLIKQQSYQSSGFTDYSLRIYPLSYAPVMVLEKGQCLVKPFRFQCLPRDKDEAYDKKHRLYKAKQESLTTEYFQRILQYSGKPSVWDGLFGKHHGVVFLESFHEYAKSKAKKILGFEKRNQDAIICPCLFDQWQHPDTGEDMMSFAVITTEASSEVLEAGYHRSPITLRPEHVMSWLNPQDLSNQDLHEILNDHTNDDYMLQVS